MIEILGSDGPQSRFEPDTDTVEVPDLPAPVDYYGKYLEELARADYWREVADLLALYAVTDAPAAAELKLRRVGSERHLRAADMIAGSLRRLLMDPVERAKELERLRDDQAQDSAA